MPPSGRWEEPPPNARSLLYASSLKLFRYFGARCAPKMSERCAQTREDSSTRSGRLNRLAPGKSRKRTFEATLYFFGNRVYGAEGGLL